MALPVIYLALTLIISFKTKTDLSSEIRLTLQTRMRALNRNKYLSLFLPSFSMKVNHS